MKPRAWIGIDPSWSATGLALLVDGWLETSGVIIAPGKLSDGRIGDRALQTATVLEAWIDKVADDRRIKGALGVGIEMPVRGLVRNTAFTIAQGQLVQAFWTFLRRYERLGPIAIVEITPQQAKLALAGSGSAKKDAMVLTAEKRFGVLQGRAAEKQAVADAIGAALAGIVLFEEE
jgi:Holliday junction resolvasome RuvABC endonuclease subunit